MASTDIYNLILRTYGCGLSWNFADIRKSRILRWEDYRVSLKCFHKSPFKREAEGDLIQKRKSYRGRDWNDVAASQGIPVAGGAMGRFSPRASGTQL